MKFQLEIRENKFEQDFLINKRFFLSCSTDLESIATSNQNGIIPNGDAKHSFFGKVGSPVEIALKADSLCKTYNGNNEAVKDVTFSVKSGEVRESFLSIF